jgi:hypothetical protein
LKRLEKDGHIVDIPEKWGIKLPMDTIEEVAAFDEKLGWGTKTDSSGEQGNCRLEMVLF